MAAENFILASRAEKELSKLPSKIQNKILLAFGRIKANLLSGIRLHGELEKYYKFRVGDYRIVYSFDTDKSILAVLNIEHRQGVYK